MLATETDRGDVETDGTDVHASENEYGANYDPDRDEWGGPKGVYPSWLRSSWGPRLR